MFQALIPSYVSLLCAAAFSIFFTWMAFLGGFFRPLSKAPFNSDLTWRDLIALFLAFLCGYSLLPSLLIRLLKISMPSASPLFLGTLAHFLLFFILIGFFLLYTQKRAGATKEFWKDTSWSGCEPLRIDLLVGLVGWVISLPVVIFISQLIDIIIYSIWGHLGSDQNAVSFLKQAAQEPLSLTLALISIVFFAPVLEEYLFRGSLHALLRKRYSTWQANSLTSIVFALMHFSFSQGIANISLLASLFLLSMYIGYVFERQRSLATPIILHITFNFFSALRIIVTEMVQSM